jgi:high-affinity iron transporter
MLASAVIVFREMLEAGLVVGIVLAATKGVPGRALSVVRGVIAGAIGACLVAAFAGQLGSLFQGSGQELFDAAVLLLAVVMLVWHNAWMAGHGRSIADEARRMGAAVRAGRRPLVALSFVCGVALLREGSESVLFLYGVAVSGDSSRSSMVAGGAIGFLAAAALAAVLYLGLLSIPVRHVFSVTTALIALLAAGLASQSVAFLQQAGRMEVLTSTVWDSSRLLPEDGWPGRVLHSLVGYTDRPSGAQVVAYLLTIAVMVATMRIAGWRARRAALSAAPPVRHDDPTAVRDV